MEFDAVGIAAINATTLAILLGGATALALIHLQALHQMKTDLVNTARDVYAMRWATLLPDVDYAYDATDPQARKKLVQSIVGGAMGLDTSDPSAPLKRFDEAEQGKRLLSSICTLCLNYPFPPNGELTRDGQPWPATQLDLSTARTIAQWADDAEDMIRPVRWAIDVNANKMIEMADAYDAAYAARVQPVQRLPEGISPAEKADLARMLAAARTPGRDVLSNFDRFLRSVGGVVASVRDVQAKLASYRERLIKPSVLFVVLLLGTLLFGMGVFIPMVDRTPSHIVVAWIPGVVYMICLLVATAWLAIRMVRGNEWR